LPGPSPYGTFFTVESSSFDNEDLFDPENNALPNPDRKLGCGPFPFRNEDALSMIVLSMDDERPPSLLPISTDFVAAFSFPRKVFSNAPIAPTPDFRGGGALGIVTSLDGTFGSCMTPLDLVGGVNDLPTMPFIVPLLPIPDAFSAKGSFNGTFGNELPPTLLLPLSLPLDFCDKT